MQIDSTGTGTCGLCEKGRPNEHSPEVGWVLCKEGLHGRFARVHHFCQAFRSKGKGINADKVLADKKG